MQYLNVTDWAPGMFSLWQYITCLHRNVLHNIELYTYSGNLVYPSHAGSARWSGVTDLQYYTLWGQYVELQLSSRTGYTYRVVRFVTVFSHDTHFYFNFRLAKYGFLQMEDTQLIVKHHTSRLCQMIHSYHQQIKKLNGPVVLSSWAPPGPSHWVSIPSGLSLSLSFSMEASPSSWCTQSS